MSSELIVYAYAGSLLVSLVMIVTALRWPNASRLLYVVLFLWAGQYNIRSASVRPLEYVNLAQVASLDAYRAFILGPFAEHTTAIVTAIGAAQLVVAVLLAAHTPLLHIGVLGGCIFLVAIAPLGIGSAFPATLFMALGLALLLRHRALPGFPSLVRQAVATLHQPQA